MVLPLWTLLASLAFAQSCPYHYGAALVEGKTVTVDPPRPLVPWDCAFVTSLEEPLRRIVAASGINPSGISLNHSLEFEHGWMNAFYSDSAGITLTDGFAQCLQKDRAGAIAILCHEVGHGVQWRGPDETARQGIAKLYGAGAKPDWKDAETQKDARALEAQADLIGRELCTRAGFSLEFEANTKARQRCNGPGDGGYDHPSDEQRLRAEIKDKPRLTEERQREIYQAVQRRAHRLFYLHPDPGDAPVSGDQTPRDWAMTPAADRDRAARPYAPSQSLARVRRTFAGPERLPAPPSPVRLQRIDNVDVRTCAWTGSLTDYLRCAFTGGRP